MKYMLLLLLPIFLGTSCNTMIGLGRDTKEGYHWSKRKIQESRQPKQQNPYGGNPYGGQYGPVY
jgi:predicted small secreted protein